jgi:hypothetical protein
MKFKVYHAKQPNFLGDIPRAQSDWENGGYLLVAEVDAVDIEEVYEKTNTINKHWRTNNGVIATTKIAGRSTSVGDIVQSEEGAIWLCMSMGWHLLSHGVTDGDL